MQQSLVMKLGLGSALRGDAARNNNRLTGLTRHHEVKCLWMQDPHTPLDQIKRFARNGAVRARKSLGKLEKEFKKRKFPWWILPLLLAALLLGSQWRHTLYWHRHLNDQMSVPPLHFLHSALGCWVYGLTRDTPPARAPQFPCCWMQH